MEICLQGIERISSEGFCLLLTGKVHQLRAGLLRPIGRSGVIVDTYGKEVERADRLLESVSQEIAITIPSLHVRKIKLKEAK